MTRISRLRLRRVKLIVALVVALPLAALSVLGVLVAREPLPPVLREPESPSLRVLDRNGRLLDEYRAEGRYVGGVRLETLPDHVIQAVLAAEDARFYNHPGVDPLAVARAVLQALVQGRVVSGASTITQQLARNLVPRPRTVGGKLREMVIALRIERELDKREILEEYLNRVEYAPEVRGIDAASRRLFDKPAARLDLAEAALLAGLPRGPSLYNPLRSTERAQLRRDRVLERMRRAGFATSEAVDRALGQPVELHAGLRLGGAEHLVRALGSGRLVPALSRGSLREVRTTLDGDLQAMAQGLARQAVARLESHDVSGASLLVVDNANGEVLAYVGAPDFWSVPALGQNDGARALRQPGSTLKPFVYAAAIELLDYTAATLLPDIELHLPTPQGDYSPRNYDGRFHGPVRLRHALGNSLNVPAVHTVQRVGPERVLSLLRRFGFASLQKEGAHYGAALALGDGEVTLSELAAAYSALANQGRSRPLRYVLLAADRKGDAFDLPPPEATVSAIAPPIAELVTDILADPNARLAAFGRDSVLDLPFPVAVKTGTSKGFRDNWTIGFTKEITVAVWVGNFDGRPMRGTSGVTGAGPFFRDVMIAAMQGRQPARLTTLDFVEREICPLSGQLATPACSHRLRERFIAHQLPRDDCSLHEPVLVARSSGLRATARCPDAEVRTFEIYPELYANWARAAGRPLAPVAFDPRCPGTIHDKNAQGSSDLVVIYPFPGATFRLDPSLEREQQRIVLRARGGSLRGPLWFVLDGQRFAAHGSELPWPLEPGVHRLYVEANGVQSPPVQFRVESSDSAR